MKTPQRILCSACTTALLLLTSGCGDDDESKCGEPFYGGSATDEAWMTMVDAQKRPLDSSQAVTVDSPTAGQMYAADASPPRFSWTPPRTSLEQEPSGRLGLAHPRRRGGPLAWLGNLLIPTAEAHLPPYTGSIYFVQVSVPGRECPIEVLTSELSWQVDDASWRIMGEAAGKDLTLQVTSAYLQDNRVKEGPFRLETPRTFRRAATP